MLPIQLQSLANTVANYLGVAVGGCSNVSFIYNWQHKHLEPGSLYDPRTLNTDCIEPRFIILSEEESGSLWYFIKGHILMEATACNIFDHIMQLYEIDFNDNGVFHLETLTKCREALSSMSLELKTLLTIMSSYMHQNKILLKHWPYIQQLVMLPLYDGMSGIQNCWLFALSYVTNAEQSKNGEVKIEEEAVWTHLLPHQTALMLKFKERSKHLTMLCKHLNDDEIFTLYENFIGGVITWRAIHRSRASQFTSILPDSFETTLPTDFFNLKRLQKVWDNRINDFVKLKSAVRGVRS
ncbi:unnamed protein product [Adineta steineri]|uniref:Uncharacterized protein n=1 Tax=Adineta steineri TaxID=433720 RepID=A0A818KXN7_9BILA|nr:unnamed protein product [Adineta steineri]CAF1182979.1 unnamed protein product [Adineta steineri]CAF1188771.1 unnamed protein product [Adineta steineri]CAF3561026.1 unnamed protein product [Adineta steineri]CAF3726664.1 unnamed protein product [Adineta steineri]